MKKAVTMILCVLMAMSCCFITACGKKDNNKIKIYVDGGGQAGNFNTMKIGPSQYNTLEVLAGEWNAKNEKYEIVINRSSLGGARDSIKPLLTQKRAPDILYQMGTVLAEDMGLGYYESLDSYYEKPNPYVEGNKKWKDIYNELEFNSMAGPDGSYYYTCLERIPIGILYNKDIFKEAGLWNTTTNSPIEPKNFSEFMSAMEKIDAFYGNYDDNQKVIPYLPYDTWYNIALESNVFSSKMDILDLDNNKLIDTKEICRAFDMGLISTDSPEYRTYLQLILDKSKYYPSGFESMDRIEMFSKGKIAMMDVTGEYIVHMMKNKVKTFELGVYPFPTVDAGYVSDFAKHDEGNTKWSTEIGNGFYGGSAGLGTGWFITNSATAKGKEAVNAAVDFMMFITAPAQNNRMINDLGLAMPIAPVASDMNPLFAVLYNRYEADLQDPNLVDWHTFNTWSGRLTTSLQTNFVISTNKLIADRNKIAANRATVLSTAEGLSIPYEMAVVDIMKANNWTSSSWN